MTAREQELCHRYGRKLSWCLCTKRGKTSQQLAATVLSVWPAAWASLQNASLTPDSCDTLKQKFLINPEHAAFIQDRSTPDQITYLTQETEDTFQENKYTLAVWIDMDKAFDKVWKDGLKLKLCHCGVAGCMHKWIDQYLKNRRARVQIQHHQSRVHEVKQGVPQGGGRGESYRQLSFFYLWKIFSNDCQRMWKEPYTQMTLLSGAVRNIYLLPTTACSLHSKRFKRGPKHGLWGKMKRRQHTQCFLCQTNNQKLNSR